MKGYYIYLISSLPMLHFEGEMPLSFEDFIKRCEDLLPERDIRLIKQAVSYATGGKGNSFSGTLRKWRRFEFKLRNEMVKMRSNRKKIDPQKYLREEEYSEPYFANLVMSSHRNPSPLEAEKMLDKERWDMLDTLSAGHYFDIDFLVIYVLKLSILGRWNRIRLADPAFLIEKTLKA